MALRANLTAKVGRAFTKVTRRLEGDSISVTLLKPAEDYDEFDELLTLTGNWFFEYSNYRKNFLLEIANDSQEVRDAIAEATHARIDGETKFAGAYSIIDGDTEPPKMTDVTWKVFCNKFERTRAYEEV